MTSSHATKNNRRYRYYDTRADQLNGSRAWRVSAHDLEQLVCSKLAERLTDQQFMVAAIGEAGAAELQEVMADANLAAATLRSGRTHDRAELLSRLVERVDLHEDLIEVTLDVDGLQKLFGMSNRPDIETPSIAVKQFASVAATSCG